MKPGEFTSLYIRPVLEFLGERYRSRDAERMLLCIALQESALIERVQRGDGGRVLNHLARGFWQFELNGVRGAVNHESTSWLRMLLPKLGYPDVSDEEIHHAIAYDTTLACILARALLWTHDGATPNACDDGYSCYLQTWRPSARRVEAWSNNWLIATDNV